MKTNRLYNFSTIDTNTLGVYEGVKVIAVSVNYELAVTLDTQLPNRYNEMVVANPSLKDDARSLSYVIISNNEKTRALATEWIEQSSVEEILGVPDRTYAFYNMDTASNARLKAILAANGIRYKEL